MASYLALPRPADPTKAATVPVGFEPGLLLTSAPGWHATLRAALVWFAVEYLVYQARYQWKDIRGFGSDQLHPESGARARLPGPAELGRAHIATHQCPDNVGTLYQRRLRPMLAAVGSGLSSPEGRP